jgi:hypothetical protein
VVSLVLAVLDAQAQARAPILDSGSSNDALYQFIQLIENSINLPSDIAASIQKYQDAVTVTHIQLNYVIAPGLYIIQENRWLQ